MIVRRLSGLVLLFLACSAFAAETPWSVAYVVRHGERADDTDQTLLSKEGNDRAVALERVLRDEKLAAVYITNRIRSGEMARPTASSRSLTPVTVDLDDKNVDVHAAAVAKQVKAQPAGSSVLLVEHSHTIQQVVKALSGVDVPKIGSKEFDRMYVILHREGDTPRLLALRYGAP